MSGLPSFEEFAQGAQTALRAGNLKKFSVFLKGMQVPVGGMSRSQSMALRQLLADVCESPQPEARVAFFAENKRLPQMIDALTSGLYGFFRDWTPGKQHAVELLAARFDELDPKFPYHLLAATAAASHPGAMAFLLERGLNPDDPVYASLPNRPVYPIDCAIAGGQLENVRRLVAAGAKFDRERPSALFLHGAYAKLAKDLAALGMPLDTPDADGNPPIIAVLERGAEYQFALELAKAGADLQVMSSGGKNLMDYTLTAISLPYSPGASAEETRLAAIRLSAFLLERGVRPSIEPPAPLLAVMSGSERLIAEQREAIRAFAFDLPSRSPGVLGSKAATAMHFAAALNNPDAIKALVDAGVALDEPLATAPADPMGRPIGIALQRRSLAAIRMLLSLGANLAVETPDGIDRDFYSKRVAELHWPGGEMEEVVRLMRSAEFSQVVSDEFSDLTPAQPVASRKSSLGPL